MNSVDYFPIAGCAACRHHLAADYDRRWLIVDREGRFLTAITCPALLQVNTEMRLGYLVMRAPGMLRMDIPLDVLEDDDSVKRSATVGAQTIPVVDEGDLAAVWFGHVTGVECRLVKVHPEAGEIRWPT
jgi:uncharacterized protein YcbX